MTIAALNRVKADLRLQVGETCGETALRHALLVYGKRVSVRRLLTATRNKGDGADEMQLDRAARMVGFRLQHIKVSTGTMARSALRYELSKGIPVLLCTEVWTHWVVAIHADRRAVWYADSEWTSDKALRRSTWPWLVGRMNKYHHGDNRWDFYAVVPVSP